MDRAGVMEAVRNGANVWLGLVALTSAHQMKKPLVNEAVDQRHGHGHGHVLIPAPVPILKLVRVCLSTRVLCRACSRITDQRREIGQALAELVQSRLVEGHHVGHLQRSNHSNHQL